MQQILFLLTGTLFRLPIWLLLWLLGQQGLIKIIFQVYPADDTETQGFCPDIPIFRRFFSGRPTLGGLITHNLRPIGIYVVVPDTVKRLAVRNNDGPSHRIVDRLSRLLRLTGAQSIGLAGQLGFIFEKRHKIPIRPPYHNSMYGSLFSLSEAVTHAVADNHIPPSELKIGILGQGDISNALADHLIKQGLHVGLIDLKYVKSGSLALKNEATVSPILAQLDILVNMTPTGADYMHTHCQRYLSPGCAIVDFSHPGITAAIPNRRYRGNRVRRQGIRFVKSLPGRWRHHDIPACSMAAMLATTTATEWASVDDFVDLAKRHGFYVPVDQA